MITDENYIYFCRNLFIIVLYKYVLLRANPISKTISRCGACSDRVGNNKGASAGKYQTLKKAKYFPCNIAP